MKRKLLLLFVILFTASLSYAGSYQIYVRQPSGEILTLDVNQSDTFNSVKAKILDKTGIHPARQRLIYAGKELEEPIQNSMTTFTMSTMSLSADAR